MYRVIIADDEPLILAGLCKRVDWNALGFEIMAECTDGESLLDAILRLKPDLLVMDIQMPKRTGIEVMRDIHRARPIPIIVISGYSNFSYAQAALRYGAVDYVLKPITTEALHGAVIKAKQQLDLSTYQGSQDSNLLIHFFRENTSLPETGMLERLRLSGQRAFYSVAAFSQWAQPHYTDGEVENALLRYDANTILVILHYDRLPLPIDHYIREHVSFEGSVGISAPFREIKQLPVAADQAHLQRQSAFFGSGFFLWPTETATESVNHFLRKFRAALSGNDQAQTQTMLTGLPDYLAAHRLNVVHFEKIFNTLQYEASLPHADNSLEHLTWQEIFYQYETMDNVILYLESIFYRPAQVDTAAMTSREIIYKIRTTLKREYASHLTLKDMATQYHMDKSYLSTLFHSEVGQTFTAYLMGVRIKHACEYLKNSQLSHNEIAALCGLNNDAYLKKIFKKVMHTTPSQYRKEHKIP